MTHDGQQHKNDIYISDNKWIRWIEYDTSIDDDYYIDDELEKMQPFWHNLMSICEPACCGIHAFDFSQKSIQDSIIDLDHTQLVLQLKNLQNLTNECENDLVSSKLLNHRIKKAMFVELVDHLLTTVTQK